MLLCPSPHKLITVFRLLGIIFAILSIISTVLIAFLLAHPSTWDGEPTLLQQGKNNFNGTSNEEGFQVYRFGSESGRVTIQLDPDLSGCLIRGIFPELMTNCDEKQVEQLENTTTFVSCPHSTFLLGIQIVSHSISNFHFVIDLDLDERMCGVLSTNEYWISVIVGLVLFGISIAFFILMCIYKKKISGNGYVLLQGLEEFDPEFDPDPDLEPESE